ncbi:MAG: hypothetical protein ACKVT0_19305 [Planctomycetaceae bacterium]
MSELNRREFVQGTVGSLAAGVLATALSQPPPSAQAADATGFRIAPFRFDVTPPKGHSLCGGWIKPVEDYDDPLEAIGYVLLGSDQPIVVCAVDWTGLLNEAHLAWRTALAEAAGTTPERVAVHCVHQHNAPFACLESERLILAQGDLPHIVELGYFEDCLKRGKEAVTKALASPHKVTHIGTGQGKVEKVASNRRILNEEGKLVNWRGSASKDPVHHELPEGLIDPWLKTIAFFDGETKIVSTHFYATHPMSYYGDGRVSSDFAGLARKRRQQDEPDCTHIYFTGCSGNIAAGKYNEGTPQSRLQLTERMYAGIVASEEKLDMKPLTSIAWKMHEFLPTPRSSLNAAEIEKNIANHDNAVVNRNRPSYMLTWIRRCEQKIPLRITALHLGHAVMLHLPAESFIEYQLRAQSLKPDNFVTTAAYGDGGPWYIPVKEAFPQGGYEVSVCLCEPNIDDQLTDAMKDVLA